VWTPQGAVTSLAGPGIDAKLTLSSDGLVGVFASDRGGAGVDYYGVTRASPTTMFDLPVVLANVSTTLDDFDPHLTPNGLALYFAPNVGGGQAVEFASRPSVTAPFGGVRILSEIAQTGTFSDPSVSPDELVIAYAGLSNAQLFYAVRSDTSSNFGTPVLIPDINGGTGRQTDVEITVDGCEIYFSSTRSSPNKQVYVATVL
jgi:Tol biopolymer transport system component